MESSKSETSGSVPRSRALQSRSDRSRAEDTDDRERDDRERHEGLELRGGRDRVVVTDGALATIIGLAAHEVPGVVGMAPTSFGEGIKRILGVAQADEGVEVQRGDDPEHAEVILHVVVAYGVNIPVVANSVRERVSYAARTFAGVTVDRVRVHVAGVSRG